MPPRFEVLRDAPAPGAWTVGGLAGSLSLAAFHATLGYALLGLVSELAADRLPGALQELVPRILYDVPLSLLARAGLADLLAQESAHGGVGRLLAGAAAPVVGVALVALPFALSFLTAITLRWFGQFRQRGP